MGIFFFLVKSLFKEFSISILKKKKNESPLICEAWKIKRDVNLARDSFIQSIVIGLNESFESVTLKF